MARVRCGPRTAPRGAHRCRRPGPPPLCAVLSEKQSEATADRTDKLPRVRPVPTGSQTPAPRRSSSLSAAVSENGAIDSKSVRTFLRHYLMASRSNQTTKTTRTSSESQWRRSQGPRQNTWRVVPRHLHLVKTQPGTSVFEGSTQPESCSDWEASEGARGSSGVQSADH